MRFRLKENQVVVKAYNNDGSYKQSFIIPTEYYPLNAHYEVFYVDNTIELTEQEHQGILNIFDEVEYKIGFCYTNAEKLTTLLKKAGYNAKIYCGWAFFSDEIPIHHAWTVIETEKGKSVLDLSDEWGLLTYNISKLEKPITDIKEQRKLLVEFHKFVKNLKNSQRCIPIGLLLPDIVYIGCECSAEQGRNIYNQLIDKYPDHECQRNVGSDNLNLTQKILAENGLMKL